MNGLQLTFWLLALGVAYTYLGYPLLLDAVSRFRPAAPGGQVDPPASISIVMAVHNEEQRIAARITELCTRLTECGLPGEVVVVSDGSQDRTVELARASHDPRVQVLASPSRIGKAAALNRGCAAARGEIVVFVDARQSLAPDALARLRENFRDPRVGAVSGQLILADASGVLGGVGLYWRYETWIRRTESRVHSAVGVSGALSAVRRRLFQAIPPETILDDLYWPLRVVLGGHRVLHDPQARAYDQLPAAAADEFRRKVRTLSGNYQLLARLPGVLLPWRNPVWIQFVSHKLLRLAAPWALAALLAVSFALPGATYRAALAAQLVFYVGAVVGLLAGRGGGRWTQAAASFVLLNAAAWVAFWVWISGNAGRSWGKAAYAGHASSVPR
jgi:cellulose synthase/poly-beta-1,6-N-acetylglucosamine synthase-like glycosyltransferase